MPIKVAKPDQTCALGSAMAAPVVAGIYKDVPEAQKAMGGGLRTNTNLIRLRKNTMRC